jgi:hypothetical protein
VTYIVLTAMNYGIIVPIFVLAIFGFVLVILKQMYLGFQKPQVKTASAIIPIVEIPIRLPTAVRFQIASKEESRSMEVDAHFDWRLRILVSEYLRSNAVPFIASRGLIAASLFRSA